VWRSVRDLIVASSVVAAVGCGSHGDQGTEPITLRFWAFGREGEVVQALVPEFERAHPGIRVAVQQIPFSAAHEKLLTSVVGRATPDIAQLGNTWVPELAALRALVPLDTLIAQSTTIVRDDYFAGIWDTNVLQGVTYGVPWYVDTRVVFYRSDLLADAGFSTPPATWSGWRDAMRRIRARAGGHRYGMLLPVNEWAQPIILGMGVGAPLLRDHDGFGDFSEPRFRTAFSFYVSLFHDSLAAPISNTQIANMYQSFANGDFAMFISGPWDVGECLRRLPPALSGRWATAPMPAGVPTAVLAPDGTPGVSAAGRDTTAPGVSLAGGSSLVVFRGSVHRDAAWAFIAYLSDSARQAQFYALTGDLPSRRSAWRDSVLARDPYARAFRRQLQFVQATPKIPEWDEITTLLTDHAEAAVRGGTPPDSALAALDRDVDRALEKRRWLRARAHLQVPARTHDSPDAGDPAAGAK
jgi:multiple sugar transport system substrate-binding protein